MKNGESLAVWTLKGPSLSDNETRVICQQLNNPFAPAAVLHVYGEHSSYIIQQERPVYLSICCLRRIISSCFFLHLDNSTSYSTLVGCTIGGFFGILLLFGLLYIILLRSQRFQKCFGK